MVVQLIDDHSRYAVASHIAAGETAEDAIAVFDEAVAAHGVPRRLLSDNGLALTRRAAAWSATSSHMLPRWAPRRSPASPYKPTTQGENERFHQALFCYLDKQPLAASLAELQAQVDAFDHIYNTEGPHQGLPARVTPLTAWEATPKTGRPSRPSRTRGTGRPTAVRW